MQLSKIKQKKAAIELSMGTVVIIVLAMTMLILGLVLVRSIFKGATTSVDTLNEKVTGEIASLFAEEGNKIAIMLSSDKTAKVKQGDTFKLAFGAQTESDSADQNLRYKIELQDNSGADSCDVNDFKKYFTDFSSSDFEGSGDLTLKDERKFDDTDGLKGYSLIAFDIPDDAEPCEQKVIIRVTDDGSPFSGHFRLRVISSGIF